jgi:hypothetical protein
MNTGIRLFSRQVLTFGTLLATLLLWTGCEDDGSKTAEPGNELPGRYYITVYYTPVEVYHGGPLQPVWGFTTISGESGRVLLGSYPEGFVAAVQMQGSGRITSGAYAGRYLNGSFGGGFWLSDFAPDAYGAPLKAFRTAACDNSVLAPGTRFKLKGPLLESGGVPISPAASKKLLASTWEVQDQFEAGYGGDFHIDLYIGEENNGGFTTDNPFYVALENVIIATE